MTVRRLARSLSLLLATAALWGGPVTAAQARGYHPNPPRQTPAPGQDGSNTRGQESRSPQASPAPDAGTPEGCFRRYDDRCRQARENRRASHRSAN